jgi:hypothetical protein
VKAKHTSTIENDKSFASGLTVTGGAMNLSLVINGTMS